MFRQTNLKLSHGKKLTMVPKWKGELSNKKIIIIEGFVQELSWNERITCIKIREKNPLKNIYIDFSQNRFEDFTKTLSNISVPNFKAVALFNVSVHTDRQMHKTSPVIYNIQLLLLINKMKTNKKFENSNPGCKHSGIVEHSYEIWYFYLVLFSRNRAHSSTDTQTDIFFLLYEHR